ncbi:MAG: nucleoside 2-deoxyribosyltransferase [Opitutales bacterium]
MPQDVYFAGPLFDHKHLIGNALLGREVERQAGGRYRIVLPQDIEGDSSRARDIRNADYSALTRVEAAIFAFDGSELDSGTVAEYLYAKMLDLPAVIFRSDFRAAGDQDGGDPWNLMCSFFPRTETLAVNALEAYCAAGCRSQGDLEAYLSHLGAALLEKLDRALATPPVLETLSERQEHLARILRLTGGGIDEMVMNETERS